MASTTTCTPSGASASSSPSSRRLRGTRRRSPQQQRPKTSRTTRPISWSSGFVRVSTPSARWRKPRVSPVFAPLRLGSKGKDLTAAPDAHVGCDVDHRRVALELRRLQQRARSLARRSAGRRRLDPAAARVEHPPDHLPEGLVGSATRQVVADFAVEEEADRRLVQRDRDEPIRQLVQRRRLQRNPLPPEPRHYVTLRRGKRSVEGAHRWAAPLLPNLFIT